MIQETNHKELSPPQKQQSKNLCPKQISQNSQKVITDSQDIKMDIEFNDLNQLNGSVSTQASNNITSPLESKDLNIYKTNNIIFPQNKIQTQNQILISKQEKSQAKNNIQTQISIPLNTINQKNENNNQIFKFNFKSNEENISFSGEYLNEIYSNLLKDEQNLCYKPKIGYMNNQNDINEQMRAILIDWLIEVHYRFRLKSETLFQTVWIIDTYLSIFPIIRAKLQLLGIASLLISCKSQEIYYPQINELIDITDGAYVKDELIEMEAQVLKVLNFNIIAPTANDFYNIISKAFNFDKKQFYLGKYFLESSLIDYRMIRYSSSVLAVSCAYIVMKFFAINNYKNLYSNEIIKENCPQKVIKDAAREICFLVRNLSQSTLKAVKDKYSLPQFLNVAQYCEQK